MPFSSQRPPFYTHFTRLTGREPIMVNKSQPGEVLPNALAEALTNKFGTIPPVLDQYLQTQHSLPETGS